MSNKVINVYDMGYFDALNDREYDPSSHKVIYDVTDELTSLRDALTEAHRVILHELDSGRTPYMLKAENGGKGLGYLEDTLSGVTR